MLFILSINYKDDIGDITPLDQEEGARTVSVTSNQRNGERKSSLRTGKKKEGNLADSRNGSSMMEGVDLLMGLGNSHAEAIHLESDGDSALMDGIAGVRRTTFTTMTIVLPSKSFGVADVSTIE